MVNILGEEIYRRRLKERMTQDQFGAKFGVSGPAIFKFEKGYVKPSFDLWMRMAKIFNIQEHRAVLMWLKSRLPDEFQNVISLEKEIVAEAPVEYTTEGGALDYSRFRDRASLRKESIKDTTLPRGLKSLIKDDEIWAAYKPTGEEINFLRDTYARFPKGSKALYREGLRLMREFSGRE